MNSREAWKQVINKVKNEGKFFIDTEKSTGLEKENEIIEIDDFNDIEDNIQWLRNRLDYPYPSIDDLKKVIFDMRTNEFYNLSERIHNFEGVNQLIKVINLLKKYNNTRRAVINLYNPKKDNPETDYFISFLTAIFKKEKEKLNLTVYFRSVDLILGLPANIYESYLLLKKVAEETNNNIGKLIIIINNAHYFKRDEYLIKEL